MPDFAPNYTVRYKLKYTALGLTHTALVRAARGSAAAGAFGARDRLKAAIDALASVRFTDWAIISGSYALEDSDIFLPDPTPGTVAAGTTTIPAQKVSQSCLTIGFIGRTVLGQKGRLFLFGVDYSPEIAVASADDWRINSNQATPVANAIAALLGGSGLVGSDNAAMTWYSYITTKYNNYWVRRLRV